MSCKILVYRLYIDDVLIHGSTESAFNTRKVFEHLREHYVAINPRAKKLDLHQVEYKGHLITETKRLKSK